MRIAATMALGEIGDPKALPALEKALRQRKNQFIQEIITKAIEKCRKK